MSGFGPSNSSVLVDDCAFLGTPDALDPATAVVEPDNWVFNNVFQELTSFVGLNSTVGVVTPALAATPSRTIRFSRSYWWSLLCSNPVNAAVVWFSFVRNLYMNQGVALNYIYLTVRCLRLQVSLYHGDFWTQSRAADRSSDHDQLQLAETVLNNMLKNSRC